MNSENFSPSKVHSSFRALKLFENTFQQFPILEKASAHALFIRYPKLSSGAYFAFKPTTEVSLLQAWNENKKKTFQIPFPSIFLGSLTA